MALKKPSSYDESPSRNLMVGSKRKDSDICHEKRYLHNCLCRGIVGVSCFHRSRWDSPFLYSLHRNNELLPPPCNDHGLASRRGQYFPFGGHPPLTLTIALHPRTYRIPITNTMQATLLRLCKATKPNFQYNCYTVPPH